MQIDPGIITRYGVQFTEIYLFVAEAVATRKHAIWIHLVKPMQHSHGHAEAHLAATIESKGNKVGSNCLRCKRPSPPIVVYHLVSPQGLRVDDVTANGPNKSRSLVSDQTRHYSIHSTWSQTWFMNTNNEQIPSSSQGGLFPEWSSSSMRSSSSSSSESDSSLNVLTPPPVPFNCNNFFFFLKGVGERWSQTTP